MSSLRNVIVTKIRRDVLTGILTVIPILVTIFVFSIFLDLLSDIGRPKVVVLSNAVRPLSPDLARWLVDVPWFSSALAICLTLAMFYLLGWSMTRLMGRQIFHAVELGLERIPMVTTVYGATKKLIDAFRADGGRAQRVVLIEFPHARMKAVGLVTRTFSDADTGEQLAAVYVPTAPNPTGGYLEIVPASELVPLDWTVDEAMAFVLSGGTTAPDPIRFSRRPDDDGARATPEHDGRERHGRFPHPDPVPEGEGDRERLRHDFQDKGCPEGTARRTVGASRTSSKCFEPPFPHDGAMGERHGDSDRQESSTLASLRPMGQHQRP